MVLFVGSCHAVDRLGLIGFIDAHNIANFRRFGNEFQEIEIDGLSADGRIVTPSTNQSLSHSQLQSTQNSSPTQTQIVHTERGATQGKSITFALYWIEKSPPSSAEKEKLQSPQA